MYKCRERFSFWIPHSIPAFSTALGGHSYPSLIGRLKHLFWHTRWSPLAITSFSFKRHCRSAVKRGDSFRKLYGKAQVWHRALIFFFFFSTGVVYTTYYQFIIMAGWKLKTIIAMIVTICAIPLIFRRHSKCNLSSVINQLVRAGGSLILLCTEWFVTSFPGSLFYQTSRA